MSKKKLVKKLLLTSVSAVMTFSIGNLVYANTQALPNGTITSQNGEKFLTDFTGGKYSGWFIDSKEDWYYFNETDKAMKTGWHHDDKDGYWYYLNVSDGKMVIGWQVIDGKEYFFQPVRDMGNYHFSTEQEKWLYSVNSNIPYGAMYVNTITPDGTKVDNNGAKVATTDKSNTNNATVVKNGWVNKEGKWYYYESDTMAKNKWLHLSGKWYYVSQDGVMASSGWKEIDGKSYYFGTDGAMYVNTTTPDGLSVNASGERVEDNSSMEYAKYIGVYGEEGLPGKPLSGVSGSPRFNIREIKNGKVYGDYHYTPNFLSVWADFNENGVAIIDNQFTVEFEVAHWGADYKVIRETSKSTYVFSSSNGVPALKRVDFTDDSYVRYNEPEEENWTASIEANLAEMEK